jgi:hypothetical protein
LSQHLGNKAGSEIMTSMLTHRIAVYAVITIITLFLTSTMVSEIAGDQSSIIEVKQTIVYGLAVLAACMFTVAITAIRLRTEYPDNVDIKTVIRIMRLVGFNGLFFLVPLAFTLNYLAQNKEFGYNFYGLQIVEIFCGSINLFLLRKMLLNGKRALSTIRRS